MFVFSVLLLEAIFARTYGGPGNDYSLAVTPTTDGGFALVGCTYSYGSNGDILFIKLTPDGSMSWAKTFGRDSLDWPWSLIQAQDGGYVIAGYTRRYGTGYDDFLLLKINSTGNLEWAYSYGGQYWGWFFPAIQTQDGGYAIAGEGATPDLDFVLLKLGSDGSLVWGKSYGGSSTDEARALIQTQDGGFAIAGATYSFGAGSYDFLLIKLNSDGSVSWAKTYGGTDWDWPLAVVQEPNGGLVVSGSTMSFTVGDKDILVIKTRGDGSVEWARSIGGPSEDMAYSMIRDQSGGYVLAGISNSDILVLKLAPDGSLLWAKILPGSSTDRGRHIIQAQDGDLAITGETSSFGAGGYNFFLLKIDQNGNYPGCLQEWYPTVREITPLTASPALGQNYTPTVNALTLATSVPNLNTTNICAPIELAEGNPASERYIVCSPILGGLLFYAHEDVPLKIYSSDGRMIYSGKLMAGENIIKLGRGIYFWEADHYKGKAVVN
ncbi:MAG: hypothetical protein ABIM46_07980 [candidate division WOR-3 bacterium]